MNLRIWRRCILALVLSVAVSTTLHANEFEIAHPDHYEFDATLDAPFRSASSSRPVVLRFDYPAAGGVTAAAWMLEAVSADGRVLRSWSDITTLRNQRGRVQVEWDGRDAQGNALSAGYYTLRLRAAPTVNLREDANTPVSQRIDDAFSAFTDELHDQTLDVMVGDVAPAQMPVTRALPVSADGARNHRQTSAAQAESIGTQSIPATGSLPYTIYHGNMHSQTNHSDGGGDLSTCTSSQGPQNGAFGPNDAFAMMDVQAGGDFLLASEHNHMYDGSTGTSTSANPATAIALFDSGLSAASNYRNANPDFMALYGLEWGVISGGGHLNIINPDALPNWEFNSSGELLGEVNTPKSDYDTLYTTMQQRGWIGQFNHPSSSQFVIGGTGLAYHASGAEVMVLTEILNSSAFSTNTSETETSRSSYVGAWNTMLERGYKLAPATNQDNHCANWGLSFTNRTGVLLPSSTPLSHSAFIDALRARRVFATEDRNGQLVLTANGRVMGESFNNSGPLTLTANYASTNGQTVQRVQFFEGVPGRNGTVSQLVEGNGTHSFTPANGEHFYYALVTQANGLRLWSAPVWVSQSSGPADTTPPTVSASESGTSGTITLSASASDNVGVTNVEFYVDGVLVGSDATAPYSMTLNSTTLADGSHALTAKAFDAAGNNSLSSPFTFSVNNSAPPVERMLNGGFESGRTNWTSSNGVVTKNNTYPARTGSWKAWLNGNGSANTEFLYQSVAIPSTATSATLSFWLRVASDETTTTAAYDTLKIQVRNGSNAVLTTLATYSNLNKGSSYVQRTFDVSAYKGQTIRIYFEGIEGTQVATSFLVDDVSLTTR